MSLSPVKSTVNVSAPASTTVPSCASINPLFTTRAPASTAAPPGEIEIVPLLTTAADGSPVGVPNVTEPPPFKKFWSPPAISEVVAMRPATLTEAPWPNRMPAGSMIQTWPFDRIVPLTNATPLVTRFSAIDELLGSLNSRIPPAGRLKVGQV